MNQYYRPMHAVPRHADREQRFGSESAARHPDHEARLAAKCAEVARLLGPDMGRAMHAQTGNIGNDGGAATRGKSGRRGVAVHVRGDGFWRTFPAFKDAAAFLGVAPSRVSRAVAYDRTIAGCRLEKEQCA
jgi:hypothetical protein